MNKAVFLDKDGTLIKDIPYNVDPALINIEPSTIDGLKRLKEKNFILIMVSNQSGVARGFFQEKDLENVTNKIQNLLKDSGIALDAAYFCPHHPDGIVKQYAVACECRKPKAGMLHNAAKDLNIDLKKSWMIGDILHDVEAGNIAGCKTILINNGNETEWKMNATRQPTVMANSVYEAADYIIEKTYYGIEEFI